MLEKIFKTYSEQLEILKNRNMIISDENKAIEILKKENYYSLINGYKDLFVDIPAPNEKYKNGTDFFEIHALYTFDRNLRNMLISKILIFENHFKTSISYQFSKKYTHSNYLKLENFENINTYKTNGKLERDNLKDISSLIANISSEISKQIRKKDFISHYIDNHGYIPLWVVVNILTFGTMVKFYKLMKLTDRQEVSKEFNINESDLSSLAELSYLFRNICAHEERLYDYKTRVRISNTDIHSKLHLPNNNGNYLIGKNDVFALLIVLKLFLEKSDFDVLFTSLKSEIYKLSKKLRTITIDDVMKKMGFPSNWEDINNS